MKLISLNIKKRQTGGIVPNKVLVPDGLKWVQCQDYYYTDAAIYWTIIPYTPDLDYPKAGMCSMDTIDNKLIVLYIDSVQPIDSLEIINAEDLVQQYRLYEYTILNISDELAVTGVSRINQMLNPYNMVINKVNIPGSDNASLSRYRTDLNDMFRPSREDIMLIPPGEMSDAVWSGAIHDAIHTFGYAPDIARHDIVWRIKKDSHSDMHQVVKDIASGAIPDNYADELIDSWQAMKKFKDQFQ